MREHFSFISIWFGDVLPQNLRRSPWGMREVSLTSVLFQGPGLVVAGEIAESF